MWRWEEVPHGSEDGKTVRGVTGGTEVHAERTEANLTQEYLAYPREIRKVWWEKSRRLGMLTIFKRALMILGYPRMRYIEFVMI